MTVAVQTPISSYTGNGVTTAFSFGYYVAAQGDLVVMVDGVVKTLTTDYTLTGIGSGGGGTCTFVTAPASGAAVVLYRDTDLLRDTDYQDNGDLLAAILNGDFDRIWLALQETITGAKLSPRAVRAPVGETLNELPDATTRAGKVLSFNASTGQPEAVAPTSGTATDLAIQLASTASGEGSDLIGFLPAGTGASASRTVQDKLRESVSVLDYGATGDGVTDDTAAIQAALNAGFSAVYFPKPSVAYLVKDATDTVNTPVLDCPSNILIFGDGYGSVIKLGAHTTVGHRVFRLSAVSNVEFSGIRIDGNRTQQTGASEEQSHGVFCFGSSNIRVRGCYLTNLMGDGVYIGGSSNPGTQNVLIESSTFDNNFRQCISLVRGQYIRIIGNDLSNTTGTNPAAGVDIEANTLGDTLRQITISGNNIRGNYFGIFCNELAPAQEITISGNTFSGQRHADIYCRGNQVVISNNIIYPVGKTVASAAIEVSLANGVQVVGNSIYGNYDANERGGIRVTRGCKNLIVANNIIRKTTLSGIRLYMLDVIGTGNTSCITVMGNILEDCLSNSSTSAPILLGAVAGTSDLTQVVIKGNIITDTRSAGLEPDYGVQHVNLTDAMLATIYIGDNIISGPTTQSNSVTGWEFIGGQIVVRAALDFDLTAVTSQTLTATVTGAAVGDVVSLGVPNASAATDVVYTAWVSAANTVSVRALRVAGTPNPANGTFNICVTKMLAH